MNSHRPTILVVEDEPIVRNFVVDVLTRQGWLVFEADSAAEAGIVCDALKDEPLDLLIAADEVSPMAGCDLADRVLAACPNAKILLLSTGAMLMPGGSFLQKPFTVGQLLHAVEGLLHPRTQ